MRAPGTDGKEDERLANRFASLAELVAGDAVYALARGWWRPARVMSIGRRRVTVAFRPIGATSRPVHTQTVVLTRLRRALDRAMPQHRCVAGEPPSQAEVDRARERGLLR